MRRGCGRYSDLLGQEVSGYPGLGGGPIHSVLQIQDCRKWGRLGVQRSLWSVYQSGKGWHVEEFGAIRGLWEDPWAGGSSTTGGEFTWNGGLNNQAWARLDRFLVSPSWLDQFSGVTQSRLSRPISDPFPIVLVGVGIKVKGSASYRLAAKMKEIKKKLKVWNREVFGRLECNKSSALQQIDFWDQVESEEKLDCGENRIKKRRRGTETWVSFIEWQVHIVETTYWTELRLMGEWLSEEQEVREGIVNTFQQMLSEDMDGRRILEDFSLITSASKKRRIWRSPSQRLRFIQR
ncbi:hypothetical protein CK203_114201 [Vitis vinifera]|uniref:Uncharacterized protein n=1 Tax=Vitis vinifera TaxID=29760 RepID=A0A438CP71_VITVI|nr:hypothetical protein CK203_114201 [Vitis vinifera]